MVQPNPGAQVVTLVGTELVDILGLEWQTCTTQDIANLAASQGLTSLTLDGATSGSTVVIPQAIASGTLSLPAATDTLVGRATTDTLTNKTLTSPTLTTPSLGVATATSVNKVALTAPATGSTITVADGKTLTANASIVLAGTDSSTLTLAGNLSTTGAFNTTLAQTATSTLTTTGVNGTLAQTSGSNLFVVDVKRTSASVTKNASAAYGNVTGLSFTVVPGTYTFDLYLPSTVASGTGGIKYAFNYTTTVLSSIQATGTGSTSAATATQQTTTTTTQTDIFTQAAVVINTRIMGTMVVTTGGTIDVQMAQNTSDGSNTVALIGGYGKFVRIS